MSIARRYSGPSVIPRLTAPRRTSPTPAMKSTKLSNVTCGSGPLAQTPARTQATPPATGESIARPLNALKSGADERPCPLNGGRVGTGVERGSVTGGNGPKYALNGTYPYVKSAKNHARQP